MERYTKAEFVVLLIMLALNLIFVFIIIGSGGISGFALFGSNDPVLPKDKVTDNQISFENGKVVIDIEDPVFSKYEDSESMLPVLGKGATGVGYKPSSADDVQVGDIVSFRRDGKVIVHRVVEIGEDDLGMYFITKGDNNNVEDGKIRFEQIDSVLVTIIY